MSGILRQYFADDNRKTLLTIGGQNYTVDIPYRTLLANNVDALMRYCGKSPETLKAAYLDGTKKGKQVSPRSIRYLLAPEGPSVGIDVLAAVALALKVQVYHLLVPELDPATNPPTPSERWIEAEVERRVAARLRAAAKTRQTLEDDNARATRGLPHAGNPFLDSQTSAGSSPSRHKQMSKSRGEEALAPTPTTRTGFTTKKS